MRRVYLTNEKKSHLKISISNYSALRISNKSACQKNFHIIPLYFNNNTKLFVCLWIYSALIISHSMPTKEERKNAFHPVKRQEDDIGYIVNETKFDYCSRTFLRLFSTFSLLDSNLPLAIWWNIKWKSLWWNCWSSSVQ